MSYLTHAKGIRGLKNGDFRLRYNFLLKQFKSIEVNINEASDCQTAFKKHESEWVQLANELGKILNSMSSYTEEARHQRQGRRSTPARH